MEAKWITAVPVHNDVSLYVFKKSFTVNSAVESFFVNISADTRYRLYINGRELAHGPCKSSQQVKHYEQLECADAIVEGENEIVVHVLHVAPQESFYFSTAYHKEKPALYFDGTLTTKDETVKIVSDESFSVCRATNMKYLRYNNSMLSLAPFEIVYGTDAYEDLKVEVMYTPDLEANGYGSWGVKQLYRMQKRPIQILEIKEKSPLKAVREYYDEDGNYNIILDPEVYTTSMLRYEFCAPKGTKINMIYTECPLTKAEDGTLHKDMRDNVYGEIPRDDYFDEVFTSGDAQVYEPFWYRVFRFIRVEFSQKPEYFQAFAAKYTYDFEKDAIAGGIGWFECSDEKYSKLWEISRNTIECCTHETFVDCSFYEQQQYVGDGRFEANYAWKFSNDSKMQKKLIIDTAHSMQSDGQIAATSPNMWVQILHIANFYYINLMREYLRFTGDCEFMKSMVGIISSNIEYFESTKTPEGLIFPPDGCYFVDWVKEWKGGLPEGGDKAPMAVYNLMYAASLKDAYEICEACGYPGLALDYKAFYQKTIDAVNKHFFDEEAGLYRDVAHIKAYSEHAAVWAIISEAVTGDKAKKLAERMLDCDVIAKSSFSKCFDLLRALDKAGLYEERALDVLKLWDVMLDKHCTTWCESTTFPRSECHGWSCIPIYEISAKILGVKPLENGYTKVQIKPTPLGLTYAKGRVPTPYGYIDVSWTVDDGKFSLDVNSSDEVLMEIVLPSGKTINAHTNQYSITE